MSAVEQFIFADGSAELVTVGSPRHRELLEDGHTPAGTIPDDDGISDTLEAFLAGQFVDLVSLPDGPVGQAVTGALETKADQADLDTLTGTVDGVSTTLTDLGAEVDGLATTVAGKVSEADLGDPESGAHAALVDAVETIGAATFVPQSTAGVYIGTRKYADLHSAVMAVVAAGGFMRVEVLGDLTLTEPVFVNSTGTVGGAQLHGVTVVGARGGTYIDATGLDYALSFGKRSVDSNSQASGISNGIVVESLDLLGAGIELWGCQRASTVRNVRVDGNGAQSGSRGIYALFSSTLQLLQTRVDVGAANMDGVVLDTCSNATLLGGGSNYNQRGLVVEAKLANSQRTTSLNVLGFHTEGNRRQHYDLQAVGNGVITPHIVTGTEWDTAYPLIHLGGDAASSALSVRIAGGYMTGSGGGGEAGDGILAERATNCVVDGTRFANLLNGVRQLSGSSGLELRRPIFESSVTNPVVNESGAGSLVLPGTQFIPLCSQGGTTVGANQDVSLTLGGVDSANATRVPVLRDGSVVGIGLRIGSTLTTGSMTVRVQRNGSDIAGCELVKGTGGSGTASVRFPPGVFTCTSTDDVRVKVATTADFASGGSVVPVVQVEYLPAS